jgi:hypothetical protein
LRFGDPFLHALKGHIKDQNPTQAGYFLVKVGLTWKLSRQGPLDVVA